MGIKDWNNRKSQSFTFGRSSSSSGKSSSRREKTQQQCIKLGKKSHQQLHHHDANEDHDQQQNQGSRWKLIWKKIKTEKQRILSSNHNSSAIAAYDPEAYSRNFDDGMEWREPEYLTRSFSARFADPSRIVHQSRFLS